MQWHQLDHLQTVCTSLQTDNHTNTSSLNFCRPNALSDAQPTVSKHWRQKTAKSRQFLKSHVTGRWGIYKCIRRCSLSWVGDNICHCCAVMTLWCGIRYDTIRDAILTCARKPTWVSLIYRMQPTTKKCKNGTTKSRKQICSEITVNSPGNPCSEYLRRRNEGLQWEGFAEKEGFKPGVRVSGWPPNNSKYDCWQMKTI